MYRDVFFPRKDKPPQPALCVCASYNFFSSLEFECVEREERKLIVCFARLLLSLAAAAVYD